MALTYCQILQLGFTNHSNPDKLSALSKTTIQKNDNVTPIESGLTSLLTPGMSALGPKPSLALGLSSQGFTNIDFQFFIKIFMKMAQNQIWPIINKQKKSFRLTLQGPKLELIL